MLKQSDEEREHAQKVRRALKAAALDYSSALWFSFRTNPSFSFDLADEIPEPAWRPRRVERHRGTSSE